MMISRAIFLFMTLFAAPLSGLAAKADMKKENCTQILSSPISDSAEVYIRLVNHYLKREPRESIALLNRLIEAKEVMNPFANKTDSLSGQLSDAMKLTIAKIAPQDWVQIQSALKEILRRTEAEQVDRKEKKEKTSRVFNPKTVDEITFNDDILDSPTWHEVGGRVFVSVVTTLPTSDGTAHNGRLYIYELVGDKLVEFAKVAEEAPASSSVSWVTVGDQAFFTFVSENMRLNLYKLNKKGISFIESIEVKNKNIKNILFKSLPASKKKNKWLLTYMDGNIFYLYELKNARLRYLSELKTEGSSTLTQHKWHSEGGRNYISFAEIVHLGVKAGHVLGSKGLMYLVEADDQGQLILRDSKAKESRMFLEYAPLVKFSGARVILDSFYNEDKLYVFEILNGALVERVMSEDPAQIEKNFFESKEDLVLTNVSSVMAVGSLKDQKYAFSSKGPFAGLESINFVEFLDRAFYSIIAHDGSVIIGEMINNHLVQKQQVDLLLRMHLSPTWVQHDESLYVITASGKKLKLTKMFSDVRN